MSLRYPAAAALTLATLLSARSVAAKAPASAADPYLQPHLTARALYSQRALKRARTILQLKFLELREQRLECLRKALERGIPTDRLLKTWFSPIPKQANCDFL